MRVALYPGSFDPVTNGHIDVLQRAVAVFDQVVVAVLENPRKKALFPVDTRVVVLEKAIRDEGIDQSPRESTRLAGSSEGCARSRTSRSRASSPTTTGSSRRRSTPSSS